MILLLDFVILAALAGATVCAIACAYKAWLWWEDGAERRRYLRARR